MVPMHAGKRKIWLSMNQLGHRIGACLGKAALKTHALQTLRDGPAYPNRAKRLECVRFIGAFRPAREGPQFMDADACRLATLTQQVKDRLRVSRFLSASMVVYLRFNCR